MEPSSGWGLGGRLAAALAALAIALAASAQERTDPRDRTGRPPRPDPGEKAERGGKTAKGEKGKSAKGGQPERRAEAMSIAEMLKVYEAHKHIGIGTELPYRLLKPLAYHPSRRYPLVVCLHGFPGQGDDNALQLGATYPAGVLARPEMRQKYPCFVLVPQSTAWWGDQPYGTKAGAARQKHFPAMTMLLSCVEELKNGFTIDAERVYLTGQEMGGFGVFNALKQDPNLWGAALTVAGGSNDPNSAWKFAHVPMWLFGGEKSRILHYSTALVDAVRRAGGAAKLTVVKDAPTNCWPQVYEDPQVWTWLFMQRRQLPLLRRTTQPATFPATQPTTARGAATSPASATPAGRN